MDERIKLEKERDILSREYFVELLPKSIDIDKKIRALVFKEPESEQNKIIAQIKLTELVENEFSELTMLESTKEETDIRRREIWKRILEINEVLLKKQYKTDRI